MATLKGTWRFNKVVDIAGFTFGTVQMQFTDGANKWGGMYCDTLDTITPPNAGLVYKRPSGESGGWFVYGGPYRYENGENRWYQDAYRKIDFGTVEQEVPDEFYEWFIENAVEVIPKTFKKLYIGDTVATSGTRVFKKLTTEEPIPSLPIWNGTDLTGTSWTLRSGWSAEAGYGQFEVDFSWTDINPLLGMVSAVALHIGYAYPKLPSIDDIAPCENWMVFVNEYIDASGNATLRPLTYKNTKDIIYLAFNGGKDATNPRLIDWLLENGELTSHQPAYKGGLYDADDNLVASWNALVYTYGMKSIENGFGSNTELIKGSPCRVLKDNSELSTGTKMVIPYGVEKIGIMAFAHCSMPTSFTIPDSVTSIEYAAFFDCPNLTDVYYRGTAEQWAAININNSDGLNNPLINATIHYNYTG